MLVPFSPPPGIHSDDTSHASGPLWVDGSNVRFRGGKAEVVGGWALARALDSSSNGVVRAIFPFTRSGAITVAYGTTNQGSSGAKLLVGATSAGGSISSFLSAPSDRTPVGISSSTTHWALDSWGDTLLAVPRAGTLYDQSGSSTAAEVTNAPDAINWMLVTQQRQAMAFGCNEESSGTFNPMCIRWSDIEDYTDWTTTATNNAGEYILEGHGSIIGAIKYGAYLVLWTQTAMYLGTYRGDPGQTYDFDMIDENCGLIGPMAVTVHNQRVYWMGPDLQPRTWVLGELPQIIAWPSRKQFVGGTEGGDGGVAASLTARQNMVASAVTRFEEIWFHYQSSLDGGQPTGTVNNRYVAYSIAESRAAQRPVWFRGIGGRTAMMDSGLIGSLTYALNGHPTVLSAVDAGGSNSGVYLQEYLSSGTGSSTLNPYITSGDQVLDNGGRRMMIRGIIPDFEDQAGGDTNAAGDISLRVYVKDRPQSTATTKGPYQITTSTTKKDFRASGKLVAVQLAPKAWSGGAESGATHDGYFRMGKPLFDVVPLGER